MRSVKERIHKFLCIESLQIFDPFAHAHVHHRHLQLLHITQLPTRSPSFAFFCNLPQYIREPYRRFLENKLRSKFDFLGCPVQIFLRQK